MKSKKKKPWPTKAAMEQVYEMNLWGKNGTKFYSGEGSHLPEIVNPYIEVVRNFLSSFKIPISVLDLGCGDFNIGKQLVEFAKNYYAVDIVEELIVYNSEKYKASNLEFKCIDISQDVLPKADCVIVRQVLQHLSNNEVKKVLEKLTHFKYIILTEHLPKDDFIPNIDIISGQGIRLKKKSGLNILAPPFNFKVKKEKDLLTIDLKEKKGVIKTSLYNVF